ncbi:MAG TPA: LamG-like jellyroll fold domain-containing protein [Verrucomicrobiae bacterium]
MGFALLTIVSTRSATLPPGFAETVVSGPSGGNWNLPVGITFDSTGRSFVWEREGRIWFQDYGTTTWTLLLDINDEVGAWGDYGLVGFALDPNFRANGHIYLMYVVDRHHLLYAGTASYNSNTDTYFSATIGRITRYTARSSDGFRSIDPSSRLVLLGETRETGIPILHDSHGVGTLLFGTDGTLLATTGDGASYNSVDVGNAPETWAAQAITDGIIKPKEDVGSYRSQLIDSLDGKILRLNPATGSGVPSNPYYDPANPRSPKSRVYALGLRNPYRTTLRPGTGSHFESDANPGVLYIGDVGWTVWEDMNVSSKPGENFGWPVFEGIETHTDYFNRSPLNQDAPNPLFPATGCSQYFRFRDLIVQNTTAPGSQPPFVNPCNTSQRIPASIPQFLHVPPVIDWRHGTTSARTWIFNASGLATPINIGAAGSPVSGSMFAGNCSIGGVWYTGTDFPSQYRDKYFAADYGTGWIKAFTFDASNKPTAVANFATGANGIVGLASHPIDGGLYYIHESGAIRRIRYSPGNLPPSAVLNSNVEYGPGPLTVQFSSTGSADPESGSLTYVWNFGDGTPNSNAANPSHTFNAPAGVPTAYVVTLTVSDPGGLSATAQMIISVNNTPPNVTINTPVDASLFSVTEASNISLTATITDAEHSAGQLTYSWVKYLHHNDHAHRDPPITTATANTTISPIGCDGVNIYYYRIELTVTDTAGLSTTRSVELFPNCPTADTPPTISSISDQATTAGVPTGAIAFQIADADAAAANLSLTATSSNSTLVEPSGIELGGEGENRTIRVTPRAGQTGTTLITITVNDGPHDVSETFLLTALPGDTTAPTVAISSPATGASVTGTVNISATASDNVQVLGVRFLVDGAQVGAEDAGAPYSVSWNSSLVANGNHTLTAVARDSSGNQTTSSGVVVSVSNAAPNPLVAAYGFSETTGTTTADDSGNNNTGTLAGATRTTSGHTGSALAFSGANQRVDVPDSNSLDITSAITMEAWVYPTALTGWRTVLLKEVSGELAYCLYAHDNAPVPAAYIRIGGTSVRVAGSTALPLNTWTHLAATYDGAAVRLYVNGQQVGSVSVTGSIQTSTLPLRIGGNLVWGEYFAGRIDDVRIYNRALTSSEVQANMNIPVGGTPPPADTTAPTAPGLLAATGSYQQVNLTWLASTDAVGVTRYNVHRSTAPGFTPSAGDRIGQATTTSFSDANLAPGTYFYKVTAEDGAGNISAPSNEATGAALADTEPPAAPNLNATGGFGQTSLNWNTPTDNVGVLRYNLHRSATPSFTPALANRIAQPTASNYSDTGLAAGNYYYRVTAEDSAGNISASSNEATASVAGDVSAPTVSITYPAESTTVSGTINLTANAADDVAVVGVQFRVNGSNFGAEDLAAPYSISWNSGSVANGTHAISAVARDASGKQTTSALVSVTVENIAPPTDSTLVAAYGFSETVGTTTPDESGNNNTGTLVGATRSTSGHNGSALAFSGANQRVDVADSNSLDASAAITMEGWVFPTALSGWRTVLMKEVSGELAYCLYAHDSVPTPAAYIRIGGTSVRVAGSAALPLNAWSHLAATYDGAVFRLYVNGQQVGSVNVTGAIQTSTLPLRLGGNLVWGEYFAGRIDDVRLYNRALSAAEVQANMSIPVGGTPPPADTTAPTAPTSLAGSGSFRQVNLTWLASTDAVGVNRYNVHRSTTAGFTPSAANRIAQPTTISYADANLAPGSYFYKVTAEDAAGNVSSPSNEATGTALADTQAPTAPTLTGTGSFGQAALSWNGATDAVGVVRYNVHRSTLTGFTASLANRVAQPTGNSYVDTGLAAGTYFYVVTAEDAAGNLSVPSNETSASVAGDVSAPVVSITSPAQAATVSGNVTISANATDDVGVLGVQFRVDGANVGAEDTTVPYSISWNSAALPNGNHNITAIARDASGKQTTSSPVTVNVNNTTPPPVTGLVAAYGFKEGAGTTTADSSGNNNNGTLSAAAWTPSGQAGNALAFSASNQRVNINDAASLDLTSGLTVEAWVYPTALTGWRTVVMKEHSAGLSYVLYAHDNNPVPAGYLRIGSTDRRVAGTAALPLNTWSHLAMTYNGSVLRLFVNGVQVGSLNVTGSISTSTLPLRIGGNQPWGEYFSGRIDEVRVYNRALTAAEIGTDMITPVP